MLQEIPDRNIPVKYTYAPCEFGVHDPSDMVRGMNNIASLRKAKGLSQSDLAEMAGVEQPTISRMERGSDSVTLRVFTSVADALGVQLADLFVDRTSAEQSLIEVYRSLPEDRKRGWQEMALLVLGETVPPSPENNEIGRSS